MAKLRYKSLSLFSVVPHLMQPLLKFCTYGTAHGTAKHIKAVAMAVACGLGLAERPEAGERHSPFKIWFLCLCVQFVCRKRKAKRAPKKNKKTKTRWRCRVEVMIQA